MSLRLRRGPSEDRVTLVFQAGELVYDTVEQRLYVGDGLTQGGLPLTDLLGDASPQLGSDLDLNSNDIIGFGNINIDGDITASGTLTVPNIITDVTGSLFGDDSAPLVDGANSRLVFDNNVLSDFPEVEITNPQANQILVYGGTTWTNSSLFTGNVNGNLNGDVAGNVLGDVIGNVTGDVLGNVVGELTGSVNGNVIGTLTGTVTGDVVGDLTGNVTGDVVGDLTGDVVGDLTGNVVGDLTGNVVGNVVGDLTGNVIGDLTGNVVGDLTGNVIGDVLGDVVGDLTGNVTGNVIGLLVGDVTGDVTGNVTGALSGNVSSSLVTTEYLNLENSILVAPGAGDSITTTYTKKFNAQVTGFEFLHAQNFVYNDPVEGDMLVNQFASNTAGFFIFTGGSPTDPLFDNGPQAEKVLCIEYGKVGVRKFGPTEALDVVGNVTTTGFVQFGRYTTAERDDLTTTNTPQYATNYGMVIYNTDANKFQGWQNTGGTTPEWVDLS